MILRALVALLLLAFAVAPAMACCAHTPAIETAAAAHHGAHAAHAHGGGDAAMPHDAKATCIAIAGLPAEPVAEIVMPASSDRTASLAASTSAEGLAFGPTAPPPKTA